MVVFAAVLVLLLILVIANAAREREQAESREELWRGLASELMKENKRANARLTALRLRPDVEEGPAPMVEPEPEPELTGELASFVDAIENEQIRKATEDAAKMWLAERHTPEHVLAMIRGEAEVIG